MTQFPLTRFQRLDEIEKIEYAMINLKTALGQLKGGCEACDKSGLEYMALAIKNLGGKQ